MYCRDQDRLLNGVARFLVDRVRDVGIEPGTTALVEVAALIAQPCAAIVAITAAHVVLPRARRATVTELAARHGHEEALAALDDLDVAHDEAVLDRHARESSQLVALALQELDPYLGDVHPASLVKV